MMLHHFVIFSIKNTNFVFDGIKLAFVISHQLVHGRHYRLAHHRAVEAEENARVCLQFEQHFAIARPPIVLILLELVIAAFSAVSLVSPE